MLIAIHYDAPTGCAKIDIGHFTIATSATIVVGTQFRHIVARRDILFNRKKVLSGGLLNDSRIVKVGQTVVRSQDHLWPLAVSEALAVLRSRGFAGCPRELRRIDDCTVVLNYIGGHSLRQKAPRWASTTRTLIQVTDFVKEFSLAGSDMRGTVTNSDWLTMPAGGGEVFFHGDPHPTNIVFGHLRRPKALIDFELATLGTHYLNLLSLIFSWAPLEPQHLSWWRDSKALPVRERVRIIVERWQPGVSQVELIAVGLDFISWREEWIAHLGRLGNPGALKMISDPTFQHRLTYARALLGEVL
jgi:hypothetical protein